MHKGIFVLFVTLLSSLLTAQQITYTSVPNIKDTFDYASQSFIFQGQSYLMRSRLPPEMFFSRLNNYGIPQKNYVCSPKLNIKYIFYSAQIGSKLFHLGAEEDTIDRRGNILIYNSDLTVYRDSVYFDYPNMEFIMCRYDQKRNKVIATFAYSIHKDSFNVRRWGIMELDTLGNILRKKEITPIARYEYTDNILVTADGGYLVSGKMNGRTTYIDPIFIKLDTNFNVTWRTDLRSTGEKFFTQYYSENLVELPNNKGYCYLGGIHRPIDTVVRKCWNFDYFSSLHFISNSGQITKNYYHNLTNPNCEISVPKGLFLKNDSVLMIFTQRYHDLEYNGSTLRTPVSLVFNYNVNQQKVVKEILGGFLLLDKTNLCTNGCIIYRTHVGKDIDGGFITSGSANINDNNGGSAYLMKTDSCGYTQDHKCKIVYKIDTLYGNTLKVHIIDSLSVLCQPIWTIEGKQYTSLDIKHNFSTIGIHTVKLWGFAGSTVDSLSFQVRVDSMNSRIHTVENKDISIYPNPARDYLEIVFANFIPKNEVISLTMTNILGQSFSPPTEVSNQNYRIDTRDLSEGVNLLQIRDKNDVIIKTERIVIDR